MPILGDALEEAGCGNEDVLKHCRSDKPHVRGCWVVDFVLGKLRMACSYLLEVFKREQSSVGPNSLTLCPLASMSSHRVGCGISLVTYHIETAHFS